MKRLAILDLVCSSPLIRGVHWRPVTTRKRDKLGND